MWKAVSLVAFVLPLSAAVSSSGSVLVGTDLSSGLCSCHRVDFVVTSIDFLVEPFCDPPFSQKFIVMKYGGVLVILVSFVSSVSSFLVAVRWYAVVGMPSLIQMRFFTVPIVVSLSVISRDIVPPVGVFT